MNLFGIGSIIDGVGQIADDLVTTKEEKLQIALQERAMDVGLMQGQIDINKEEARHGSIFIAGWRPFIGWVGGLALAYQFLLYPLLVWLWAVLQGMGWIPCHLDSATADAAANAIANAAANAATEESVKAAAQCSFGPPPTLPADALFAIVTGMLGIGGMRSFDKLKRTDTKQISAPTETRQ